MPFIILWDTHTHTHTHTHTVIEALGSAGSGQFGSLGVSWNTSQAPRLSSHTANPPEDDLGKAELDHYIVLTSV